ncbi:hypothetical protein [Saccharopolyspora hordei]|uniref:Uncharacterized protein n=1 Tax=Saccharopolyspora hordei TaxID=1838 RepID=A0A853ANR4_9PSEU|nr:hypothetical protein [Saccharopolyspora hordei]NYI83973.1 hypothetical protein [Saccharopolyspora hordei]
MSGTHGTATPDTTAVPHRRAGWLDPIAGTLFIQCEASEAEETADLVEQRLGAGLVITGRDALNAARLLRERGFDAPLLCDAARYAGKNRLRATASFSRQWLALQRDLGLPVLTDSGYVGEGDVDGLRTIVRQAQQWGDGVIACLPLHQSWLRNSRHLQVLQAEIRDSGVVVALVLEHQADPFGVQAVLRGFLTLLATGSPVLLLRSDVSAVGALCFGAVAAAAGTRSKLRHLYPVLDGGPPRPPLTSVFVKHCLSYVSVDKLATAVQLTPDQVEQWECRCDTCNSRTVDRFATMLDPSEQRTEAFRHSVEVLLRVHEKLRISRLTPQQVRKTWVARCSGAGFFHEEIRSNVGVGWNIPAALKAWRIIGEEFVERDVTPRFPHEEAPGR